MKVVHIVTGVGGGAGIAALRLHRTLLIKSGISSDIIQKNDTDPNLLSEHVHTLYESQDFCYRIRRKLGMTPEMKQNKLIPTYSRNYEYEIATFPMTSYRIEDHPLVKEADIIHLHWVANFLNYPTFFKNVKKPIVWTLHDKNPFHGLFHTETDEINNASQFGELDKKIVQDKANYLQQAKNIHIVTPSMWLFNKSSKSEILGRFLHYCIANSIDLDTCNIEHLQAKREIGVNNGKKTLMFIAHSIDIPRRGFYIMRDAIDQIEENLTDFNLITVGGDKININRPSINHIHYNSTNDAQLLNTIYAASDVQLLPSKEDNLPNVMLESFANGTPVISFANGGMAEHIKTGENGILVDSIGVKSLKDAIEDFLNDKYSFDREAIRKYAEVHFEEKQQAQKYIDLYKEILNKQ